MKTTQGGVSKGVRSLHRQNHNTVSHSANGQLDSRFVPDKARFGPEPSAIVHRLIYRVDANYPLSG